jgi:glycosyltransferase involved in cell wall biosynthesis
MRILYDGQIYEWQAAGGINRYFANLIGGLPRDYEPALLVGQRHAVNFPSHPNLRVYEYGGRLPRIERLSYRLGLHSARLRDRLLTEYCARGRFDLLHPTYYRLLTGRRLGSYRAPTVLTVWDMIDEVFPAEQDPTGEHAEWKRSAVQAAARLICISEHTKTALLERYPVPEERVSVIHLASEIDESLAHGPEPVPERPYFLYVGSRAPYKNFGGLLRAFARVAAARPGLALCVVGGPFNEEERRLIGELGLEGRLEHYGHAGDRQLAKLYRCSLALVYPSFYEGFGIPPLEAMACGTAAVVANTTSLPEVVGDAGLLFDPRREDELESMLLLLTDDGAAREELIRKGRLRAQHFGWQQTVAQTLEVYRSAAL